LKKVLVLFAHPALQKSRVNKILIDELKKIDGVTFHDLYQIYPEFDIDVQLEQDLLKEHDIIVFMYPFFWYSAPAILKEWQDLVLEHGWAYGSQGNALKGKLFFNIITTGGQREAYCSEGYNNFTMRMLLAPIEQTVNLCKMIFLPPFVVHGTHSISYENLDMHKTQLNNIIIQLRDDKFDAEKIRKSDYLNDYSI
jgi:glutathione-regulated potassium-efflux system ancillary protein KefG